MKYKILLYTLGNVIPREKTTFCLPNPDGNPMLAKRSQELYDCLYDTFDIIAWACGRHSKNPYTIEDNIVWNRKMLKFVDGIYKSGGEFDFSIQMSGHPNMVHPYDYFVFTDGIARELDMTILDSEHFPIWRKDYIHEQDALYQNAKGIIAFSKLSQHILQTFHMVPKERTTVICPSVATFSQKSYIHNPYKLLFAGSNGEHKGLNNLLMAFPVLYMNDKRFSLTVVGPEEPKIEMPGVTYLPFQYDDKILKDIYAVHGIFVMPSYKENLGLVYLEAMAQGLPVIVTSRGGMAEYIRKSRAGIVVSPDSATAIINAVTTIINQYDSYSSQAFLFANLNSRNSIVASRIAQFIDYSFQKSSYCEDYTLYK
ncbi:glycosyltransferase family 4 protein [Acutalibacter muris]|jgi:glycosyltransferase involved in cell wall biosynthesis|uniref:glycosyltransferase family 4 protein n=1 Tax=Acutalibacter muris TaxID=1796620 RepID=UPI0026F3E9F6|nr:glycosyltransferase family 4 protein [Acutalibacter muris]